MNEALTTLQETALRPTAWALVHFLWQGTSWVVEELREAGHTDLTVERILELAAAREAPVR